MIMLDPGTARASQGDGREDPQPTENNNYKEMIIRICYVWVKTTTQQYEKRTPGRQRPDGQECMNV